MRRMFVSLVSRPGILVLTSALFSLVLVRTRPISQLSNPNLLPPVHAEASQHTVMKSSGHFLQQNPDFAKYPSWSQDFSDSATSILDPSFWNVLVGPAQNSNKEQQYYTNDSSNLRIENGVLRLIATRKDMPQGYKYASARLETQGKKSFLYGRFDVDARVPQGVGTWPAVWLLPANDTYAKKSPTTDVLRYKNGGEIDILEAVGFQPNLIYGVAHTVSDIHDRSDGSGSYGTIAVYNASREFNKYTLLWTPTKIIFAVNEKPYYTYERRVGADYTSWPFDQPFYLILNLAMGGTWGGMDIAHYPDNGIDNNALPASLDVRSIRYYSYVGPKS